jgi:predicted RNA-binding protein Jag
MQVNGRQDYRSRVTVDLSRKAQRKAWRVHAAAQTPDPCMRRSNGERLLVHAAVEDLMHMHGVVLHVLVRANKDPK